MDDSINNRNNKTTRFNGARDNNINCIICKKKLGHIVENCYHLSKAEEVVSEKKLLILLCKINSLVIMTNYKKIITIILQKMIIGTTFQSSIKSESSNRSPVQCHHFLPRAQSSQCSPVKAHQIIHRQLVQF